MKLPHRSRRIHRTLLTILLTIAGMRVAYENFEDHGAVPKFSDALTDPWSDVSYMDIMQHKNAARHEVLTDVIVQHKNAARYEVLTFAA